MSNIKNYQVLARKYRPNDFKSLVGQEALVKTISNSMKLNRLAHAFLLTGIRGVGKTTTARIIAKTVNCINPNFDEEIVFHCAECPNCKAFANGSHPDVIEMDAASKTGINDIREIIENANYLPQLGSYKIYIIDEVHMLSNNAFNALLKTLEEPPSHVKFIFATTELKKIPITILSRCQKFDLKRLSSNLLKDHLHKIARFENIDIEDGALEIIAKNSEGSVRDSLSLLDQSIALSHGNSNKIDSNLIEEMLCISDKEKIYKLLNLICMGNIKQAILDLNRLYENGADLISVIEELFEATHFLNKAKILPEYVSDLNISEYAKDQIKLLTEKFDLAYLSTMWQILFKGLQEINNTNNILYAAEMIIIKLGYSSGLPSPLELANSIESKNLEILNPGENKELLDSKNQNATKINLSAQINDKVKTSDSGTSQDLKKKQSNIGFLNNFLDLLELCKEKKELLLYHQLIEHVHLVNFSKGKIEVALTKEAPKDIINNLTSCLNSWFVEKWQVILSNDVKTPTIKQQQDNFMEEKKNKVKSHPLVSRVLEKFPGSSIVEVLEINDNIQYIIPN